MHSTAAKEGEPVAASATAPRGGGYAACLVLLMLLFIQPLTRLMLYAARSDLYSYILLVPFITGYLLYLQRGRPSAAYRTFDCRSRHAGRNRHRGTGCRRSSGVAA